MRIALKEKNKKKKRPNLFIWTICALLLLSLSLNVWDRKEAMTHQYNHIVKQIQIKE